MIGNDIVDWEQAKRESNWQRKGFLAKIFTPSEQRYIREASNPERMVWTLWSFKESVYKANIRTRGNRIFAPQKIACQLSTNQNKVAEGTASYGTVYRIRASLTEQYVSSVAFQEDDSFPHKEVVVSFDNVSYANQHARLHNQLVHDCATALVVPLHTVCIHKNENGVPTLHVAGSLGQCITIPVSLSHHGHYGAFVAAYSQHLF